MPIQIRDIYADTGGTTPVIRNKFWSNQNVRIRWIMYVPKDIANNSTRVNHDLAIINWSNNVIRHVWMPITYIPEWADKWVYHQIDLGPNPINGSGWMWFQVASDVQGINGDIAYSPEKFVKIELKPPA